MKYDTPKCREHFKCVFEQNPLISLIISPKDGKVMDANTAASKFYGYSKRELTAMNIADLDMLYEETLLQKLEKLVERNEKSAESRLAAFRHRTKAGELKDVEVYCSAIDMLGEKMLYFQIIDISARVQAEKLLKESEEKLKAIVELSPDAIIVCQDFKIIFANSKASKLLASESTELISRSITDFLDDNYISKSILRMDEEALKKRVVSAIPAKAVDTQGRNIDVEISAAAIFYNGQPSVQLVIRDISEDKREIERAVSIQKQGLAKKFPIEEKAKLNYLWIPAKGVSGDFYQLHKINEDLVLGIMGDVSGKGVTAALNVSALKIMFYDALNITTDPVEVLRYINSMVLKHIDDDYIAASCFSINFKEKSITAVGAGISEFIHYKNDNSWRNVFVKGPFLGMFEDSHFGQSVINFEMGDRLLFYTDGLNEIFEEEGCIEQLQSMSSTEFCEAVKRRVSSFSGHIDDCTCIIMDL